MGSLTIQVLRAVLVMALMGSVFVQVVMVPMVWNDMDGADPEVLDVRAPLLLIVVLGIATTQVVMVCLWRLLTMVRRGTVFSDAAFRFVDIMIAAVAAAAVLAFTLGVVLAPGEAVAPGRRPAGRRSRRSPRRDRPGHRRDAFAAEPGGLARGRGEPPAGRARRGDLRCRSSSTST